MSTNLFRGLVALSFVIVFITSWISYKNSNVAKERITFLELRVDSLESILDSTLNKHVDAYVENSLNAKVQGNIIGEIIRIDTSLYNTIQETNNVFKTIDNQFRRISNHHLWYERSFNRLDSALFNQTRLETIDLIKNGARKDEK